MKIYEVDGRKVWLDKAPEGYVKPTKPEKKEETVEPKAEVKPKAKKTTSNKARKEVKNK